MNDISTEILSDIEREKLEKFAEDKFLVETVKKYVLAVCYKQGVVNAGKEHVPTRNWAMNLSWGAISQNGMPRNDEELGQNLRALTYAVQLVGSGFSEIAEMKKVDVSKEEENNPAE